MSFSDEFCAHIVDVTRKLPVERIEAMAAGLAAVRERGGRLFFLASAAGGARGRMR